MKPSPLMIANLLRALLVTLPATMARQNPTTAGRKSGKVYNVPHGGGAREVARRRRRIVRGQLQPSEGQARARAYRLSGFIVRTHLDDVPGLLPLPASSYSFMPGTVMLGNREVQSTRRGSAKVER